MIRDRPPRLDRVFAAFPVYFITFSSRDRTPIPSLEKARQTIESYGTRAGSEFNVALGRYVVMPDHVHLFVQGGAEFDLSKWMGGLKRALSVALELPDSRFWQAGFFDHVLRGSESYSAKWEYVRDNPVRAGLVTHWDQWPHAGEISVIDRA
jgi:putative transposase